MKVWTLHELSLEPYDEEYAIIEGPEVKVNDPPIEVVPLADLTRAVEALREHRTETEQLPFVPKACLRLNAALADLEKKL